jgi:hypothetical protein
MLSHAVEDGLADALPLPAQAVPSQNEGFLDGDSLRCVLAASICIHKLTPRNVLSSWIFSIPQLSTVAAADDLWRKFGGKACYTSSLCKTAMQDFFESVNKLPQAYREAVLDGKCKLQDAEDIIKIIRTMIETCRSRALSFGRKEEILEAHDETLIDMLTKQPGYERFHRLRLLGLVQRMRLGDRSLLEGYDALLQIVYKGCLTLAQIADLPPQYLERLLLSERGPEALLKKLITPEQAAQMPTLDHLIVLLSGDGIKALQKGCITVDEIMALQGEPLQALGQDPNRSSLETINDFLKDKIVSRTFGSHMSPALQENLRQMQSWLAQAESDYVDTTLREGEPHNTLHISRFPSEEPLAKFCKFFISLDHSFCRDLQALQIVFWKLTSQEKQTLKRILSSDSSLYAAMVPMGGRRMHPLYNLRIVSNFLGPHIIPKPPKQWDKATKWGSSRCLTHKE